MNSKLKLLNWPPAAIIIAVFFIACAAIQRAPQRIYFARDATEARAAGYLRGHRDEANFVLRAQAGQHMRLEIRASGATRGTVIFPNGEQEGSPGGVFFDGILPATGDYQISVGESPMADGWKDRFTLVINVVSERSEQTRSPDARRNLASYAGKYPSALFRHEPALKTRLRRLLGANYRMFFDRLQTELPITNDGGVLIIHGCMAHECTVEESFLGIDLSADQLHVAIKSASFGGRLKTWSEGGGNVPAALRRAMNNE
jgi:hypothetical protein